MSPPKWAAAFRFGSSPLVEGLNVIVTSIEGIESLTGIRGPDIDVMRFRLQQGCETPQSMACF